MHPLDSYGPRARRPEAGTPIAALLVLVVLSSMALSIGYASFGLDEGRYWDERFSVRNVRVILTSGSLRPANGYYQSLSYLPQTALLAAVQALHRLTGEPWLAALDAGGRFTPTAYLLCRSLQAAYGAGCLVLVYLLGRRLFSPEVGLLGAALLASTPWQVQAASMFKPDVLLALTVLVALYWSLAAVEQPTLRRYALAGFGVALAVSTKLTGALAAMPLALGTALAFGSLRQRAVRLLAAGAVAVAVFVLLNPYLSLYATSFEWNLKHYTGKALGYGGTRLGVLGREAGWLLSWAAHGWLVGAISLAAGVALAVVLWRRRGDRRRLAGGAMLLAFPLAYSLAYAAVTPHFKGNNFFPVLPFTSLLAAWAMARGWSLAVRRFPRLGWRRSWLPIGALLLLTLAPRPAVYVYRQLVPATGELAWRFLGERLLGQSPAARRRVYAEAGVGAPEPTPGRGRRKRGLELEVVGRLDQIAPSALEAAAGEIFLARRLEGEGAAFFHQRAVRADPGALARFEPRLFHARGPAVVAIAHAGASQEER